MYRQFPGMRLIESSSSVDLLKLDSPSGPESRRRIPTLDPTDQPPFSSCLFFVPTSFGSGTIGNLIPGCSSYLLFLPPPFLPTSSPIRPQNLLRNACRGGGDRNIRHMDDIFPVPASGRAPDRPRTKRGECFYSCCRRPTGVSLFYRYTRRHSNFV